MSPVHTRRTQHEDLDAIIDIERGCFAADGDAFSRRTLRHLICNARGACYVACDGDRIVGYISLLTRQGAHNVRIYSVAVSAEARGCGAGQALVSEALDYARREGFFAVTLEVRTDNAPAIALYTKNGFRPDRILPHYYHDGSDGLRMIRSIIR